MEANNHIKRPNDFHWWKLSYKYTKARFLSHDDVI